jgi:hypothetical protein
MVKDCMVKDCGAKQVGASALSVVVSVIHTLEMKSRLLVMIHKLTQRQRILSRSFVTLGGSILACHSWRRWRI